MPRKVTEYCSAVESLRPDVLILDLRLPGLNGLDVAREVAKRVPRTKIVVLSMHADVPYVQEALQAGAIGYVLKDAGVEKVGLVAKLPGER